MPVSKSIRWWPAIVIGALVMIGLSMIWIPDRANRQMQVMPTMLVCVVGAALLCLWFFAFSRLRWKIRLWGLGVLTLVIGLGVASFQMRGFTGDLVPHIAWRWSSVAAVSGEGQFSGEPDRDYPQFLGPDRNGILKGVELEADWIRYPPKLLWRVPVGEEWMGGERTEGEAEERNAQGVKKHEPEFAMNSGFFCIPRRLLVLRPVDGEF